MRTPLAFLVALLLTATVWAQGRAQTDAARAGWDALNAGRLQEAAAIFGDAVKRSPTPAILLGAALVAHLQQRHEEARQHLVAALRIDPSLTAASLLLGDVLHRQGDIDGAILVYERALERTLDHPQILKRLETWRKEAELHGRFGQKLSDHFTVLFEGPAESALAERAVAILEAAYWRIGTALYTYPPDVITVVLYTREQFRDVTQSPDWAGGAYDGRIRVPVRGALQNLREFERVLAHEFTHALVRSLAPRGVPSWLNEGLAALFEGSDFDRYRRVLRAGGTPPSLASLEGSFASFGAKDAALAYAQSVVATQALLDQAGAPAVVNLLTEAGAGTPFAAAFERHVLMSYADFQKRFPIE
jgi:hypothetical protein